MKTNGGGERVRTDGLLRARQALSQLSYTPKGTDSSCPIRFTAFTLNTSAKLTPVMGPGRCPGGGPRWT